MTSRRTPQEQIEIDQLRTDRDALLQYGTTAEDVESGSAMDCVLRAVDAAEPDQAPGT
jgi:hypothetical protein